MAHPGEGDRQHSFDTPTHRVTWEFHTEFVTVTWTGRLTDGAAHPLHISLSLLADAQLIGAMRIDVIDEPHVPMRLLPGFRTASLCLVDIESGAAQVATDFVADSDRFTRFDLAAAGLSALRRSIMGRRLLEIETYRAMALLGLPLARASRRRLFAQQSPS